MWNVYADNMTGNDNTVNIKPYHHGDLRGAVIETALGLLEKSDAEGLSLREVAREVGVSATAIYRHFPNKDALLDALAANAIERLSRDQAAASEAAGGGVAGFNAFGRTYVRFALANPALFRLLSARMPPASAAEGPMKFVRPIVDDLLPADTPLAQRASLAMLAWAIAHGLAVLILDGLAPHDEAMIDAVIDSGRLAELQGQ